jgi:hypothetical protein
MMAVSRCAVVNAEGSVLSIIIADPDIDPPHEPTQKLLAIPSDQPVGPQGWRWSAEEGFVDMNPKVGFKKVEAF